MVAEVDKKLLESHGHQVIRYIRDNDEIDDYSLSQKISLFHNNIWSRKSYEDVAAILSKERPDIVHAHNIKPLISPSVIYAAKKFNLPFVWTLHNYPLVCVQGAFLRNNRSCMLCAKCKSQILGLFFGCYSRPASTAVYFWNKVHRLLGTWKQQNLFFVVLTQYMKKIIQEAGIPGDRIFIKGNTIYPDPGFRTETEDYAVFVGRPVEHKGILVLLEAIRGIDFKIKIIGGSPLLSFLQKRAKEEHLSVDFLGALSHEETIRQIKKARFLVLPSLHIEGFPLVIVEAFACGVPVITSRLGPLPELVEHNQNGLLVEAGNAVDLSQKMLFAIENPHRMQELGINARDKYIKYYHHDKNYEALASIYDTAMSRVREE